MPNPDSYEIGINWSGNGVDFVDEAANTKEFRTAYGRADEFAPAQAGTATVILGNEDGRFTPEWTAGPLYGDLEPGRRIRIKATQTPTTYDLFNGYITRIVPNPVTQIAMLECEDVTRHLRDFHLNLGMAEDKLSGDRVTAILDAVGIAVGDRVIDDGQTEFPYPHWRNTDALTALQEIVYNELGGLLFVAPDGKVTFQDRHYRAKHALDTTLTRGSGMALEYERRDDQVYDKAELQAAGIVEGAAGSQVWSLFPLPEQIAAGATLILPINYQTPAKDVITPASATDYSATANQDGTGADRTADLSSVFTDYGGGAQWEIENTGATALWLQKAQIRGTPLQLPSHLQTVTREASGSTSPFAATYVPGGFGLITSRNLLGAYAEYIVERYKTPQPLLRLRLQGATAALLTQMLTRQLSDRVKVVDTGPPMWVSYVDDEFFIERVEHYAAIDDDAGARLHETSWTLTSFLTDQFWILGTDTLGESTILGY